MMHVNFIATTDYESLMADALLENFQPFQDVDGIGFDYTHVDVDITELCEFDGIDVFTDDCELYNLIDHDMGVDVWAELVSRCCTKGRVIGRYEIRN